MKFTVWQLKPEGDFRPLLRGVEELKMQLVHWTGESGPDVECRTVTLFVDPDGRVTVEHSWSRRGDGPCVEHVTRATLEGWEEG